MNDSTKTDKEIKDDQHNRRDAETQTVLGIFITFISTPVILGTFWAQRSHAMIVNLVAGFILLGIGLSMIYVGRKNAKKLSD
jgi:putative Mn2+ efflux pump MntP